jgi:predicted nucleic-acid-binding Zn-ribbon protein
MKTSGRCPKCGGAALFHSACVMDRGEGNVAMCLAIMRQDPIHADEVGQFEVYVCRRCGFSELYVVDAERLPLEREDGHDHAHRPEERGARA